MHTPAPTDSHKKALIIRLISDPHAPTAPIAWSLEKRPTTTMSDALYNVCKSPVAIRGKQNLSILPNRGPSVKYGDADFVSDIFSHFQN